MCWSRSRQADSKFETAPGCYCAGQEVDKLTQNLRLLQAVIADAEEKQVTNEAVRVWLDDLKQVVYDADDVLDEWNTRDAISQLQSDVDADVAAGNLKKVFSCLLSLCLLFKHAILRHDIGRQIKDINKRLDRIFKQMTLFGLKDVYQAHIEPRPMTSSRVDVSQIHGRDKAKEVILSRLLGETSSQGTALRVVSIVGIGGLGKTALAKLIFNEVEVFKTKMWVCVSETFNLVRVAKAIIKEAAGEVTDSVEWQEVSKCLCRSVEQKKFLLVLDDVWTQDPRHCKDLKDALNGGAPGSRIIVTTRDRTVAKNMGSTDSDIYNLEKLSNDESWLVLRDIALVGIENELETFEKLGREIAIKCEGVPLAITILASLLFQRQTKEVWRDVLASNLWKILEFKNAFLPSLFLSYYSLPPISKQCFLYCAILGKDFRMHRDYLIRLWISQGFFGFDGRSDQLERDGKIHFHILAMRSFFQDFVYDSDGNIRSCKMHDLVHDFAMYLCQSEYLDLKVGDTNFDSERIRHVSASDLNIPSISKGRKLRTLVLGLDTARIWINQMINQIYDLEIAIPKLFNELICLRTLILCNNKMYVLPNEVEKLVHLRYLDLSESYELIELPETICNLYNLQVLALNGCQKLVKLPEKIGKLSNLRHLEIEGTGNLSCFPKSIAALSSLRTLNKFIVSDGDDGCNIGELQLLNNLQGALELEGLGRVTDGNEADRAELKKKKNLRELTFYFDREESDVRMKSILEKLEPHEDLEVIKMFYYSDMLFPNWFQSCSLLTHIVQMYLYGCNGCKELPAFGKLPTLKTLGIQGMNSVTRIGSEFYRQMTAFPKLESLIIEVMERLEEWEVPISKDRKIMPHLVQLSIEKCPMLRALPSLGSLKSLERLRLVKLQSVKHIGDEFYGFDAQMTAFPKLDSLIIEDMEKLEEWEVPILKDRKIMPLLVEISLEKCPMLRALPSLGSLESLERLTMVELQSVKHIGDEFYGFDAQMTTFPKLEILVIEDMEKLEEWEVPISKDKKIMPLLVQIYLTNCPMLRALPCLGSLESLEELRLGDLPSVERVGAEFGNESSLQQDGVTFPKLKTLTIWNMDGIEEWSVPLIVPCLEELHLYNFPKLKTLPTFQECMKTLESLWIQGMPVWEGQEKFVIVSDKEGSSKGVGSCGLRVLEIKSCPKLRVVPDHMFSPSLQYLELKGDVGNLYNTFPSYDTLCSITHVALRRQPHSALPNGFHQLKALQSLEFYQCSTLDFDLKEELGNFTELQHLTIYRCPVLEERYKGDDWSTILPHVPEIIIGYKSNYGSNYYQGLISHTHI